MRRTLSALFVVLFVNAVGGGAPTVEARMNLNGTYAFTTFRSCTVASSEFTIDTSGARTVIPAIPPGGVFRQNSVDSGTIRFNADGTGTSTGRSTTMNISNTSVGVSILSISEFSTPFTNSVNADNTVEISFGEVAFTILLGSGTGLTGTASPRSARVQIGNGANTLVSAPRTSIAQETLHFFNPDSRPAFTQYRLCVRSGPQVKM